MDKIANKTYRMVLIGILCLSAFCMLYASDLLLPHAPLEPVKTQQDSLVYLKYADIMKKEPMDPRAMILVRDYKNGSKRQVELWHNGTILKCDSARYYKEDNSFDAFGNVVMTQGDTLTLVSDSLYYKGVEETAEAHGKKCVMTHRKTRLESTSIFYDRKIDVGSYDNNGKLYDQGNVLTSVMGQYTPYLREAIFRNSVVLLSEKKDTLKTNELFYYTDTKIARVEQETNILANDGTFIYALRGDYDTKTGISHVYDRRSHIIKDMRTIEGDSLYSNKQTGVSEAFGNVRLTDDENKCMLTGGYCSYNQNTGVAVATEKAVAYEYSQKDTLYVHADTLKMFSFNINTDSAYHDMHAYRKVRAYRIDLQAVCDSMVTHELDSCTYLYGQPILWNEQQQIFGEEIRIYNNDSTVSRAHIINQAMTIEELDSLCYNQVSSKEMFAYFKDGEIEHNEAKGNVYVAYFMNENDGTQIGMNYTETTELKVYMVNKKVKKIWMPAATGTIYPIFDIPSDKRRLTGFAWFDYIRPKDKDDIFEWRSKGDKYILKKTEAKNAPIQKLDSVSNKKGRKAKK